MNLRFLFLLSSCVGAALAVQSPSPPGEAILLTNARVIDGTGQQPYTAWIQIRAGVIERIGRGQAPPASTGTVLDLKGRYLLPGLIDAHVHISSSEQARTALLSGVTTARSMGVADFADVGLSRLIAAGAVSGPELLAAGYHVRPEMPESFFLSFPSLAPLMKGVRGVEAFQAVTRANLDRGVDFIKVVATDRAGLPHTDPRRQIMSEAELRAVVELAEQMGIPVAAHAHGTEGAEAAVRAGVRSIEHGTYLNDSTLELMARQGTYLVPTVAVVRDLIEPGGDYDNVTLQVRGRHMYPRIRRTVRKAHQLRVPIVAATDTGYGPRSILRLPHELLELVECGLTPLEALQSATTRAASLLRIEGRTGRIAEQLEADLIVVEDNPLEDLTTLQDPLLVISNGKVVLERLRLGMGP